MLPNSFDIGIDLGTASVLVYVKGQGIVLQEPSVMAIDTDTSKLLAVGEDARRMLGRTPGNIQAIRPLREGVIADYAITEMMLRSYMTKAMGGRKLVRPRVMVCIPSGVTGVEKRAVIEAAMAAGAKQAFLIEEPMAAALGAGLDISQPCGNMIVDIGGGTTDIAVLSLNGIVISSSLRIGGDRLDEEIVRYIRKEYSLLIGERSAEELKKTIVSACEDDELREMDVRGRDLLTGLPKSLTVNSKELYGAVENEISEIINAVRLVLEKTPPELAADIIEQGMVLTGGGALIRGLDRRLSRETDVPAHVAENPLLCVALGTGKALENIEVYSSGIIGLKL